MIINKICKLYIIFGIIIALSACGHKKDPYYEKPKNDMTKGLSEQ